MPLQSANPKVGIIGDSGKKSEEFFETVCEIFQRAKLEVGNPIDRFYDFAGRVIQLRFAGPALIPRITPALEHLFTTPTSEPSLTVYIWDQASTQVEMPKPPWGAYGVYQSTGELGPVYTRRGEVRGYNDDRIYTAYHWDADVLTMLDLQHNVGVYFTHQADRLPFYETGAPLRSVLHWWLQAQGLQLIHAGAVGLEEGGVLLAGKGGSGKSTTALTCLNSRLNYVSDDYCVATADPAPYVYNLYCTGKVRADNTHRVPHLMSTVMNGDRLEEEKAIFFLNESFPQKLVKGFPVRAVLVPRVTGETNTTFSATSSLSALQALSLSTMAQLPRADHKTLRIIQQLVNQVPCYHLNLGTDLVQIPEVLLEFLTKEKTRSEG